ncbi:glycosyltransferase family 4 protein [Candidatus Falkowbacteria bacterium]|uniref:Glycosyl transferase family 1 domain-containing protein n=1 Tax=Candidatus Buchananbacteria bacterium CG10_big_fil_rev_8_21_14_0_10_33_19 TaxID=1974525 RepID=A0A2H0W379_9BACT|nr:glycosyltransferase family 4 protein [Candidatus Falkowbacteria bacterium]PIS05825.1 MAG: hypothetical protein COT80_03605 [Candidatus Buchananbacteria bacterium CG10_big_fil_rev_8_21_14_0_10_33_19]
MVVCYFGLYNQNYSRNKILINGLRKNQVEVIECHSNKKGLAKFWDLIVQHNKIRNQYDVMVVGFPGQLSMILARFVTSKPIVFDAFLSFYDSMVFDRKIHSPNSLKALYFWFIDWLSCLLANKILLDTNEHIKYFVKTFNINKSKFHRIFIGADETIFYPREKNNKEDKFVIHFHGTYIPLQGIKYIIDAANILKNENIVFNLIGSGQQFKEMEKYITDLKINNINLTKFVPIEEVAEYISKSDMCLGIFGDTDKAKRVIPNKLYECIAMKKPVLTASSDAILEKFDNYDNILLCNIADSNDLAAKILELKNNHDLLDKIAENGYSLFTKEFSSEVLGKKLIDIIKQ